MSWEGPPNNVPQPFKELDIVTVSERSGDVTRQRP